MKKFVSRIAVVIGAAAVSVGLIGAVAAPANADSGTSATLMMRDTSWGR
jgi:hypothetical protein